MKQASPVFGFTVSRTPSAGRRLPATNGVVWPARMAKRYVPENRATRGIRRMTPKRVSEDPPDNDVKRWSGERDWERDKRHGHQYGGEWIEEGILQVGRRRPVWIDAVRKGHCGVIQLVEICGERRRLLSPEVQPDANGRHECYGGHEVEASLGPYSFLPPLVTEEQIQELGVRRSHARGFRDDDADFPILASTGLG